MENLNAEQIKKALECCHSCNEADCKDCGYRRKAEGVEDLYITCTNVLIADALALINSQEQRIWELEKYNANMKVCGFSAKELAEKCEELAVENERLTRLANLRQRDLDNANDLLFKAEDEIERLMREKTALECIVSTARNQAKADTVRKMQTAIEEYYSKPTYQPAKDHPIKHTQIEHLLVVIDQIAKKMLEGGNEN